MIRWLAKKNWYRTCMLKITYDAKELKAYINKRRDTYTMFIDQKKHSKVNIPIVICVQQNSYKYFSKTFWSYRQTYSKICMKIQTKMFKSILQKNYEREISLHSLKNYFNI